MSRSASLLLREACSDRPEPVSSGGRPTLPSSLRELTVTTPMASADEALAKVSASFVLLSALIDDSAPPRIHELLNDMHYALLRLARAVHECDREAPTQRAPAVGGARRAANDDGDVVSRSSHWP